MPKSYEDARRFAMELSYDERAKLSEELWWSLHPPAEDVSQEEIDASWAAEIKRRIEEMDSGVGRTVSLEELMADMDARIAAKRREQS
jgi:putative addiction module component (TIGR02574 family)